MASHAQSHRVHLSPTMAPAQGCGQEQGEPRSAGQHMRGGGRVHCAAGSRSETSFQPLGAPGAAVPPPLPWPATTSPALLLTTWVQADFSTSANSATSRVPDGQESGGHTGHHLGRCAIRVRGEASSAPSHCGSLCYLRCQLGDCAGRPLFIQDHLFPARAGGSVRWASDS